MSDAADKRTIIERLLAVMAQVDYVQKEKKAGMKYSIVSHDAVTAKVRPALVKEGVIYFPLGGTMDMAQNGNRCQMHMVVRFMCPTPTEGRLIEGVNYIDVACAGYGIDDQDKGPGKAISYCVKYALLKALGMESGDDPDYDQDKTHESEVFALLKTSVGFIDSAETYAEAVAQISKHTGALTPDELTKLRGLIKGKAQFAPPKKAAPQSQRDAHAPDGIAEQ